MKTASMVLGIVGGAFAIIGSICLILFLDPLMNFIYTSMPNVSGYNSQAAIDMAFSMMRTIYFVLGIVMFIGGALGLIGGIIVKNNNTTAGVLMIIGTVLGGNLLLLVGAIFAFIREKQPAAQYAPYPPYPPYQNPPYQPYQQPYQQNPQYPGQQQYQQPYAPQDKPNDKGQQ